MDETFEFDPAVPEAEAEPGQELVFRTRLGRSSLELVSFVCNEFAQRMSSALSACLNVDSKLNLIEIRDGTPGEFFGELPVPRCLAVLKHTESEGAAILSYEAPLVFPMLEVLLGGVIGGQNGAPRPLTEVEFDVLATPLQVAMKELGASWRKFLAVTYTAESFDGGEIACRAMRQDEAVTILGWQVDLAGVSNGKLELMVPYRFWRQLPTAVQDDEIASQPEAPEGESEQRMLDLLLPATMELQVVLRDSSVTLNDLIALEPGKILMFDHALSAPVAAQVNGSDQFEGHLVAHENRRAFQVKRVLNQV